MTRNLRWGQAIGRLATLAVAGAVAVLGQGCKDDTGGAYSLFLQADRTSLSGDGADFATVRVSVLDGDFNPPSLGSQVILVAAPSGNVNNSGASQGVAQTDTLGFAEFQVRCTAPNEALQVLATFDGQRGILTSGIQCNEPPAGDWTVQIAAEPRRIGTASSSQITVRAVDAEGSPVPEGTSMRMEITGNGLEFSRGGVALVRPTDVSGTVATTVVSSDIEGSASICARFEDERFGSTPACVAVVVSNTTVEDASCIGTFSTTRAPADGEAITTMTITVSDRTGSPIEGAVVDVDIAAGEFVDAGGAPVGTELSLDTDVNGDAIGQILAPTNPDSVSAIATATFSEDDENRTLTCEFVEQLVFYPRPSCLFQGMDPGILGVQTSGINESGELTFCFTGLENTPVPAPERVTFDFAVQLSGATLGSSSAITDELGCVSVELFSGTQAGNVEIRATYPFGSTNSVCTSGPMPIRGARPNERGMNLVCETSNVGALLASRGDDLYSSCEIECWTYLRDRFGNPVNFPDVQVFFASEQGTVVSPISPDENGLVVTRYRPNGVPPRDVEPLATEPRIINQRTGSANNPRDMVVTLVVWTNGEEGWEDTNGNGQFDEGEVFTDLTEPWLDMDDDNVLTPAAPALEYFVDVANEDNDFNGEWDIENSEWDTDTAIWAQSRVVLSGEPMFGPLAPNYARDTSGVAANLRPDEFSFPFEIDRGSFRAVDEFGVTVEEVNTFGWVLVDEFLNSPSLSTGFELETTCTATSFELIDEDASGGNSFAWERRRIPYTEDGARALVPDEIFAYRWESSHGGFLNQFDVAGFPVKMTGTAGADEECSVSLTSTVSVVDGCDDTELALTIPTLVESN